MNKTNAPILNLTEESNEESLKKDSQIELLDMNEENKKQYLEHAKDWDNRDLLRVSQIISDVSSYINRSNDPYLLMEVSSLKLLEMERSVSLDALLRSDNLSVGKDDGIKKNDLENYTKKQVFSKKDFNIVNDQNKVDSVNKGINKDNHNKRVKNQIKEEKKINESDASNSITIDIIQDNWKNFIDKLHIKKPSIASVMDNSVPVDFKNGKIIVQTTSSLEFHLNMINKNSGLVKNILNDQFKIELDFVIEKKSESYSDDNIIQDSVDGSNIQDDDQLRDKIVDLFDGEILT